MKTTVFRTQEECDRQLRAWALLAETRPPVRRGYEHKPVDEAKVRREAKAARQLMKQMTCSN